MATSGLPRVDTLDASRRWERLVNFPYRALKNFLWLSHPGRMVTFGSQKLVPTMDPARLGGLPHKATSTSSHCPITSLAASQKDQTGLSGLLRANSMPVGLEQVRSDALPQQER